MPKSNSPRLVTPNGAYIQKLRLQHGWDTYTMGIQADCNAATVVQVERGRPCFIMTLNGFKHAFKLDDVNLLILNPSKVTASPQAAPASAGGKLILLKIRMMIPFTDYDFTDQLVRFVNFLIKLIDPEGGMEVISVTPGSVIIELEMDESDGKKLVSALGTGQLNGHDVHSIMADFGMGEEVFLEPLAMEAELKDPAKTPSVVPLPTKKAPYQDSYQKKPSLFERLFGKKKSEVEVKDE